MTSAAIPGFFRPLTCWRNSSLIPDLPYQGAPRTAERKAEDGHEEQQADQRAQRAPNPAREGLLGSTLGHEGQTSNWTTTSCSRHGTFSLAWSSYPITSIFATCDFPVCPAQCVDSGCPAIHPRWGEGNHDHFVTVARWSKHKGPWPNYSVPRHSSVCWPVLARWRSWPSNTTFRLSCGPQFRTRWAGHRAGTSSWCCWPVRSGSGWPRSCPAAAATDRWTASVSTSGPRRSAEPSSRR